MRDLSLAVRLVMATILARQHACLAAELAHARAENAFHRNRQHPGEIQEDILTIVF